jgi:1,4-alpha-glucan branching enzyme
MGKEKNMKAKKKRVEFKIFSPVARQVYLSGDFNAWSGNADAMKKDETGTWKKTKILPPGKYEYKFIVDGVWGLDPDCPDTVPNNYGTQNNVIELTGPQWSGKEKNSMVEKKEIYLQKLKEKMHEWNAEIDKLEAKAGQIKVDAKIEYEKRIVDLKEKRKDFEAKLAEMKKAGDSTWEGLKQGLENSWEVLKTSFTKAKAEFERGYKEGKEKS